MNILTARQVAEILHVSYDTALAFLKSGAVDCKKIGHQYFVEETKLEAFFMADGFADVNLGITDVYNKCSPSKKKTKLRRRS